MITWEFLEVMLTTPETAALSRRVCLLQGIVCIPMGMSYALLANLPPVYGLYTALVPPVMYMLFGTCSQLSLGVSETWDLRFDY